MIQSLTLGNHKSSGWLAGTVIHALCELKKKTKVKTGQTTIIYWNVNALLFENIHTIGYYES